MSFALYWKQIESPIGPLTLCRTDQGICAIEFGGFEVREPILTAWAAKWWRGFEAGMWHEAQECPMLTEAAGQLHAYFRGELDHFSVPLDMRGTPFQTRVWQALLDIPHGEVRSYKAVAAAIGQPLAVRAVGGANNRNPVAIIVPCHRVIGADGSLVGYGGGMPIKTYLLALEQPQSKALGG